MTLQSTPGLGCPRTGVARKDPGPDSRTADPRAPRSQRGWQQAGAGLWPGGSRAQESWPGARPPGWDSQTPRPGSRRVQMQRSRKHRAPSQEAAWRLGESRGPQGRTEQDAELVTVTHLPASCGGSEVPHWSPLFQMQGTCVAMPVSTLFSLDCRVACVTMGNSKWPGTKVEQKGYAVYKVDLGASGRSIWVATGRREVIGGHELWQGWETNPCLESRQVGMRLSEGGRRAGIGALAAGANALAVSRAGTGREAPRAGVGAEDGRYVLPPATH